MKGYIIGKFDSKKVKWNFYSDLFDTYEDASKKANELGSTQYDIFESVRHENHILNLWFYQTKAWSYFDNSQK